jgi:hypothetical protein
MCWQRRRGNHKEYDACFAKILTIFHKALPLPDDEEFFPFLDANRFPLLQFTAPRGEENM